MLRRRLLVTLLGTLAVVAGFAPAAGANSPGPRPLPAHVFAPYYFNPTDTLGATSQASGAHYLTLAFLQTPQPGSCTVDWNGDPSTPVSPQTYGAGIAAVRAAGGEIVPSFGGAAADTSNTEIADSCTDVQAIAKEYERVITTYNVTRLDFDVEEDSINAPANRPGIDRRNKAIALVEKWAKQMHRTVQFVYTIPTNVSGLDEGGVHLLQNAVANGARIDIVNIMTFDYYDDQSNACAAGNGPAHEMGDDTITAAGHLLQTLRGVYPHRPDSQLWRMIGVTEDIGRDDFGPCETLTTDDAQVIARWAMTQRLAEVSFWSIQRDTTARSHVPQTDWQFSHTFEPVTSNRA
jgi:chitinase